MAYRQMQSHYRPRDEDDYELEDYDEYEEEGSEEEEEEEDAKEEPVPSKEEQAFLSLREQIKEQIRQKKKKQSASADKRKTTSNDFADKRKTTSNDGFGSFFGPSKPVIASRVLDESRAIRETNRIVSQISSSSSGSTKGTASASSEKKAHVQCQQHKVVNEVKKKAQTLKDMRDYSFLLSDDADFPTTDKEEQQHPASRKPFSNSDGRSVQASSRFKAPMGKPVTPASSGHESKNSVSKNVQSQTRVRAMEGVVTCKPRPTSAQTRRVDGNDINGSGRPIGHTTLPSKVSAMAVGTSRPPAKVMNDPSYRKKVPSAGPNSSTPKNHYLEHKRPSERLDRARPAPKQQLPSQAPKRQLPLAAPKRQLPLAAPKRQLPSAAPKRQLPSSAPIRQLPSSKPQMKSSQQMPVRDSREDRLKKKPMKRRFDEEDDEDAIQMIRNMFGYNPNRYVGADEDVSDMEADFSTIQREELRSSKIARKEDEEQLRLIEEEERRERMRKKQKLSQR